MTSDKEKELRVSVEMITKDQKKKELREHRRPKDRDSQVAIAQADSKFATGSSAVRRPRDSSNKVEGPANIVDRDGKLKIDEFTLPENKKSLGNKPFKLIEPGKEPILEIVEKAQKPRLKDGDEKNSCTAVNCTTAPNGLPKEEASEEAKNELSTKKCLLLEIVESPSISPGTVLAINPEGLVGSKRGGRDGCVYFGTYAGEDPAQVNDYAFPLGEEGFGKRHFAVEYDRERNTYFLKTLRDGTGTFVRINTKAVLTSSTIISFNNIHLAILLPTNTTSNPNLHSKSLLKEYIRDCSKDSDTYHFS